MRKRIIIGLLAVVVIGVVAFFLSQPRRGTLAYHKRQYLAAIDRLYENDWRSRLSRILNERGKIESVSFYPSRREHLSLSQQVSSNRNALVRLGYLSERLIAFSNMPPTKAFLNRPTRDWPIEEDERLVHFDFDIAGKPNTVLVIAPNSSIRAWEEWLRRIDVVENPK